MAAMIVRRRAWSSMGVALAGRSAWMLSLRWKVNSGCASRLAYQSRRLGGLPVMYTCLSIWWNRISMRRGCPVFLPLVMMSIDIIGDSVYLFHANLFDLTRPTARVLGC